MVLPSSDVLVIVPLADVDAFNSACAEIAGAQWGSLINKDGRGLNASGLSSDDATHFYTVIGVRPDTREAIRDKVPESVKDYDCEGMEGYDPASITGFNPNELPGGLLQRGLNDDG